MPQPGRAEIRTPVSQGACGNDCGYTTSALRAESCFFPAALDGPDHTQRAVWTAGRGGRVPCRASGEALGAPTQAGRTMKAEQRETQGDEEKGSLCLKDADTIVSDSEI